MSALPEYKIGFTLAGKLEEVYFGSNTGSVFDPPQKQAESFIDRNKGKFAMKLYWQDIHSEQNLGWKFQRTVPIA